MGDQGAVPRSIAVDGQTEGPGGMGPFWPTSPGPVGALAAIENRNQFGDRPIAKGLVWKAS